MYLTDNLFEICRGLEQLTDPITADLYSHDEDKLYRLVHDYFKRLVIEWEDDLDARPGRQHCLLFDGRSAELC